MIIDYDKITLVKIDQEADRYKLDVDINDGFLKFNYLLEKKDNYVFDFIEDYCNLKTIDEKHYEKMKEIFEKMYNLKVLPESLDGSFFDWTEKNNWDRKEIIEKLNEIYFSSYNFEHVFKNLIFLKMLLEKKKIIFDH